MVVEPKAKKEKEKDAAFKELVTIGKAMVEGDLLENKAWSLKELVKEEATMVPPCKSERKKGRMGLGRQNFGPRKDSIPHCPKQGRN